MCDLSFLLQVEAIERAALAQLALLPHLQEGVEPPLGPDEAVAEFVAWLDQQPKSEARTWDSDLRELIGIG